MLFASAELLCCKLESCRKSLFMTAQDLFKVEIRVDHFGSEINQVFYFQHNMTIEISQWTISVKEVPPGTTSSHCYL